MYRFRQHLQVIVLALVLLGDGLRPGLRSARERAGTFSLATMWRCAEPIKSAGFLAAVLAMAFLKARGWTPLLWEGALSASVPGRAERR